MTASSASSPSSSSTAPTSTLNAISPTAAASADSIVSLAMARKALTALLYLGMTVNGEDPWHVLLRYLEQQALADTMPPPASPSASLPSVQSGMWANHRREVEDAARRDGGWHAYANCRGCKIPSTDFNDHVPEEP